MFSVVRASEHDRTRGDGLKLCQGRFGLDFRRNFLCRRVVKHWHKLSRGWWCHLKVFQTHRVVALRDVGSVHGGMGWGWGSERSSPTLMLL